MKLVGKLFTLFRATISGVSAILLVVLALWIWSRSDVLAGAIASASTPNFGTGFGSSMTPPLRLVQAVQAIAIAAGAGGQALLLREVVRCFIRRRWLDEMLHMLAGLIVVGGLLAGIVLLSKPPESQPGVNAGNGIRKAMRLNNRIAPNFANRFAHRFGSTFAAVVAASAVCATPWHAARAANTDEALGKLAFAEELAVAAHQTPTTITGGSRIQRIQSFNAPPHCSEPRVKNAVSSRGFLGCMPKPAGRWAIRMARSMGWCVIDVSRLPSVKNDQFALVELLDLYTANLQTNEKKIEYLNSLVTSTSIPEPVRSHLAVQLSRLMDVKLMPKEAKAQIAVAPAIESTES